MKKFYITTAIDYASALPHIGHAYEKIAADVLARYWRQKGADVLFQTGVDEHGLKITKAAQKALKKPQEYVDEISLTYQKAWDGLNISYDNFVRTTDPRHKEKVQKYLQILYKKGFIYKGKYIGYYCVGCEAYINEKELENEICPHHQKKCDKLEEDVYFFQLSKFQKKIYNLIKSDKLKIAPEARKNEILSFLKNEKLKDIAISRSKMSWGVELPWDKKHVVYVWVDALFNYLTGERNEKFWPADLHIIGKDIIRFHCVIWPAILLALELELPKEIFAHGYLTVNDQKMSKTIGNVVDPNELTQKYPADAVRYYFLREFPFSSDGDFSEEKFEERYRADLANNLGNLVQRVLKLAEQNKIKFQLEKPKILDEVAKAIEKIELKEALDKIWENVIALNQDIDKNKPWEMAKKDPQKLENYLNKLANQILMVAKNLEPFLPETASEIKNQLKTQKPKPIFI